MSDGKDPPDDWARNRELVDRVFGGKLAGMDRVAQGDDPQGGHWEAWLDPRNPERSPRLIARPAPGGRGTIGLLNFGSTDSVGITSHSTPAPTGTAQFFAICAAAGTTNIHLADETGALIDVSDVGPHPDGRTQLFAGSTGVHGPPRSISAYGVDGRLLAQVELGRS